MAVKLRFRCPDCNEKFAVEVAAADAFPDFCPLCGVYVGGDPDFVPSQMNIGTGMGKAVDQTYRQMENASLARAEAAGDPALKITNMKDNLREGDTAGVVPNNVVTQVADQMGHSYFQGGSTEGYIAQAKTGRERGNGSVALRAIQGGGGSTFAPPAPPSGAIKGSFGGGLG